jgi:nucleotide-binding universal stress UspA family protein
MFKRILVATDASEYSVHALKQAVELAKLAGGEIELLHVVDHPAAFVGMHSEAYHMTLTDDEIAEIGNSVLNETVKTVSVGDVPLRRHIATGYADIAILEYAEKYKADLIVMGTKGHRPLVAALMGSVTQRVVGDANCPVLVVK